MGLQTQVRASYLVCRLCLLSPVLRQKWKAKTLKRTAWVCFQTSPLASSAFTRPGQRKLALILLCSLSYLFMLLFLGTLLKRISRGKLCFTKVASTIFQSLMFFQNSAPLTPCQEPVLGFLPLELGRPGWLPQLMRALQKCCCETYEPGENRQHGFSLPSF